MAFHPGFMVLPLRALFERLMPLKTSTILLQRYMFDQAPDE